MSHLEMAVPMAAGLRLPFSRDQLVLLIAAVNQLFLGLDTYLAHMISGTLRSGEWVPVLFGPAAGVLLLVAGLIALRWRAPAMGIAFVTLLASMAVGLAGMYFHWVRAILPEGPPGERISLVLLVWAPPLLGPLAFTLVGALGMSAAWLEDPTDSGRLWLPGGRRLPMPFSKTHGYYVLVGIGAMASLISSVLDHARTGFANPWLWLATAVALFATVAAFTLAAVRQPGRRDLQIYLAAMLLLIVLGIVGAWLHVQDNLIGEAVVVPERFIRGAPFLAPLLYSDMGLFGIVAMLPPGEAVRGMSAAAPR